MRALRLDGKVIGRLTVIRRVIAPEYTGKSCWECLCECGKSTVMRGADLLSGKVVSCGCWRAELAKRGTHMSSDTVLYETWSGIKKRCYNKNGKSYPYYGGRGIAVCDRWLNSFENFAADMGEKPTPKHSLDRIDNNGPYAPWNCRWATMAEQCQNRRPRTKKADLAGDRQAARFDHARDLRKHSQAAE